MKLVLEFDPGDPPSGRVVRDGEEVEAFSGRIELYAALERARLAGTPGEPDAPEDPPPAT